jgi:NTP pyrophosphatase (non-canonical NTP hydrolase)
MTIDLNKYVEFVNTTTSQPSKNFTDFFARLAELQSEGFSSERLLTASVGMCAETGEFTEIVKKIVFQGKPVNQENLFHLKRELGDIMWYVAQACMGLDISLEEVIQMNFEKLSARYPEGAFSIERSENRKEGDL